MSKAFDMDDIFPEERRRRWNVTIFKPQVIESKVCLVPDECFENVRQRAVSAASCMMMS
ncbi:MAG TPA: hypothetical protein VJN69_03780 [Candidatus Acidoferrales bacterium]|nr:hypothetical protein [Candidatus Acidoferrales bacterium]